jgi:ribosomal protein S12 methylthiotransferase accessory factor
VSETEHPLTAVVRESVAPAGPIEVLVHLEGLAALRELNQALVREGRTCLVVREELGTAFIGPWLLPGRPGCHACLLARKEAALHGDAAQLGILRQLEDGVGPADAGWAGGPARHFVAALVAAEVAAMAGGAGAQAQALEAVLAVRLDSLETRRRPFLPNPLCPVCGQPEADRPDAASLELRPVPKPHPRHYRALASAPPLELLERTYLDADHGVLTGWWRPAVLDEDVLPVVSVSTATGQHGVAGHGRAGDHRTARVIAMCEALERFGGIRPWGRRTKARGSFAQLAADAVDPRSFGLPSAGPIEGSPERLAGYSPDLSMSWVWAFSFGRSRPVLVPEQIAYYGHITPPEERFVMETSNGCALGSTLEEAILHGILELAERDAFLVTWHARLEAPRIDLASITDRETVFLIERFQRAHGCRVEAFDITPPEGIPCFWVMAVDESGDEARPRAVCSAGASLDPEQALRSALFELAPIAASFYRRYERERERALRMLACPDEVTRMEDHSLVNALPEAWPRFGFLDGPTRRLEEAFPHFFQRPPEVDLTRELRGLIANYLEQGLDVLVVDQTSSEHRRVGMHCVKVLIPGTLPMTFGHRNRRLGLDRLRTVPVRLGRRSRALTDEDVSHDPHPFP